MRTKQVVRRALYLCGRLWVFMILTLGLWGCKNDTPAIVGEAKPFDPSKPVIVTDFTPKSGGMGQRLIIYGQNFGNDPKNVTVLIGGQQAVVINALSESLYCLVPKQAFKGDIEVRVGGIEKPVIGRAEAKFDYKRKLVVSTLAGYRNARGDEPWKDGKFKDADQNKMASGFWLSSFMRFDPTNPKHLWVTFDENNGLYLINFEDSTITKKRSDFNRPRSVDFSIDGKYMIVAQDRGGENDESTLLFSRVKSFLDKEVLTKSRQCNGASIHPINGEMYFNSYAKGEFFRFDLNQYFTDKTVKAEQLYVIQDPEWEYRALIHPTGNYAYILVINQGYIMRADYNWEKKRFNQPYLVCGKVRESGYRDGVGSSARVNQPYQGVFVKNQAYVEAGKPDAYDFYFTDLANHAIRMLTPEGAVTTFAGRGSSSLNTNPYGYVNGDLRQEARFDRPSGIAYNEKEQAFYIGDRENRRIRKVALEEMDENDQD